VVLVETRNPLQHRAAARAMANFGFAGLRVVNPYDVAFREARSASARPRCCARPKSIPPRDAVRRLPLVVGTTSVGHRELHHPYAARIWRTPDSPRAARAPVALLFGCEKFGLSNEDLSHCHWLMRIPTVDADLR